MLMFPVEMNNQIHLFLKMLAAFWTLEFQSRLQYGVHSIISKTSLYPKRQLTLVLSGAQYVL